MVIGVIILKCNTFTVRTSRTSLQFLLLLFSYVRNNDIFKRKNLQYYVIILHYYSKVTVSFTVKF